MKLKPSARLALAAAVLEIAVIAGGCGIINAFLPSSSASPSSTAATTTPAASGTETETPAASLTPSPSPAPLPTPSPTPVPTASPSPTPSPVPTPSPTPAPLTVTVKYIKVTNTYVTIKLAYPSVSGMADETFQSKFNAAVKADMKKQSDQLQADAKAGYDDAVAGGYDFTKYTLDSKVKVHINNGVLLSMDVRMYAYTGGAHGNSDSRFYTLVDETPGRQLTLLKLFTQQTTGKNRVLKSIKTAIAKSPDGYFESPAITITSKTWFYVTATKLHIVFPVYSIAPGAAGEPEFSMPLSLFKDILIPEIPH